jgi:DNA (cytosine-5)-methyltransferase 1
MKTIEAVDLFAGAGGTSTGLIQAAKELGFDLHLTAINHWDIAISSHALNHPGVTHLCQNLNNVKPLDVVPSGRLDLLVASPECTHHSNARGGKPMDEQSRAGADFVTMWAEKLYIENILIENVKEFLTWGPLDENRRPIEKLKGQLFLNFIERLKALDYVVDYRLINAANYGDATTRERLFILARKSHKQIAWPEPTHSKTGELGFLAKTKKWRPAREIIDWDNKGNSIFGRKKPLKENTMRRIMKGLEKFGGQPFIAEYHGPKYDGDYRVRSMNDPLPTQDTSNRFAFCQPFVLGQQSGAAPRSVEEPIPTIAAAGAISLIEPYIVKMYGKADASSIDKPLPTIVGGDGHLYLCEPFIISTSWGKTNRSIARSVEEPIPTIVAQNNGLYLCEPYLVACNHGDDDSRSYSIDKPVPTITGVDALGLAQPFLVNYNSNGGPHSVEEPLDTVTGKDRFGLVVPMADGRQAIVDVLFRMLTPKELAAAMSFPENYVFNGPRDAQVKQIGNAVAVRTAKALCKSLLS